VAACLALGLVAGVVWWWLAPTGDVVLQDGSLFAVEDPEVLAGQDVIFALVTAVAGVAVGVWVSARSDDRPVQRLAAALPAGQLGALVAWQIGRLLGPDVPTDPGVDAFPAPLDLHALGLLATWPALTATVVFVGLFVAGGFSGSRSRR
jgi:hypothetical protein